MLNVACEGWGVGVGHVDQSNSVVPQPAHRQKIACGEGHIHRSSQQGVCAHAIAEFGQFERCSRIGNTQDGYSIVKLGCDSENRPVKCQAVDAGQIRQRPIAVTELGPEEGKPRVGDIHQGDPAIPARRRQQVICGNSEGGDVGEFCVVCNAIFHLQLQVRAVNRGAAGKLESRQRVCGSDSDEAPGIHLEGIGDRASGRAELGHSAGCNPQRGGGRCGCHCGGGVA